jgi:polysaccharide pyruvyl transferase WcaK-like protein
MINGKKLIEVRKVGFVNKGAELMLYAILKKIKKEYPHAVLCMEPYPISAPIRKIKSMNMKIKPRFFYKGLQLGDILNFFPNFILNIFGIVADRQVDIVLDAAGFAYSDEWNIRNIEELENSCARWRRNGTKVILLPQAFGPFKSDKHKALIKKAIKNIDLVYCRERESYEHLTKAVGSLEKIKLSGDFTNLIEGIVPESFDRVNNQFCIVPNYRMIDKTNPEESKAYLPFMIEVTRYLFEKGKVPFILAHEGVNDEMLAEKIRLEVDKKVQIITEVNPLKIKGIIGTSTGIVGSRFHGLVSALSQGVPALATGWSHKYKMLFQDYKFQEGLLSPLIDIDDLHKIMDFIFDRNTETITNRLNIESQRLKLETERMWVEIIKELKNKSTG